MVTFEKKNWLQQALNPQLLIRGLVTVTPSYITAKKQQKQSLFALLEFGFAIYFY